MIKGHINSIETFGLVDGPGIRTVVFLSGCKLRCLYCHNPETWMIGEANYTPEELAKIIIRNKPYFKRNNGGVTFSGGEPLLQSDFIIEVAKILKKEGIHIALDTSGCGVGKYDEILKYIDLVILDIKAIHPEDYIKMTSNTMDEFNKFKDEVIRQQKPLWIRQVIVPGINDTKENMDDLREYLKQFKTIEKIELLPYNTYGVEKYHKLNLPYVLEGVETISEERIKELYEILTREC